MWGRRFLPILTYHRVGLFRRDHMPTVHPETFEKQMGWLHRWRYRVVTLSELTPAMLQDPPWKTIAITFDDGLVETYTNVLPVLKRYGFSATVFVISKNIGLPGFLDWDQVRELSRNGMMIGSHTQHHACLPGLRLEEIEQELVESKQSIEGEIQKPVNLLSYPSGGYSPAVLELAKQAGYRLACTTNRWVRQPNANLLALGRIKVTERDCHPLLFWVKLSGYYDAFRYLQPPT